MSESSASLTKVLLVYVLVGACVVGATRLELHSGLAPYVHLLVAAIFLVSSIAQARGDLRHFGIALGGLLEPSDDGKLAGPLGLWDLARALRRAFPFAARELGVAIGVAALVFPLYAAGFYWWYRPESRFVLVLPSDAASLALAQLVVVALPEEAFFRGYLQTALGDVEARRLSVLGVLIAPWAWVAQAVLFAILHFAVEPNPARLAVFFPALLFGWVRAWRSGIGAALSLHAMSNLYSETLALSWL